MKYLAILLSILLKTFVFAQTGPGGVGASANLAFWLDANAQNFNSPVDQWPDVSGNNVPTTVAGNPMFVSGMLNGRGAVRFDGSGDEVQTDLTINAVDYDQLSVIAVYIPRVNHAGSIWGEDNGGWDRFLTDITIVDRLNSAVGAGYDPEETTHPSSNVPGLFVTDGPTLATVVYDDDLYNGTHIFVGGELVRSFTSNVADYYYPYSGDGYTNFYVGAIGSNGFRFNGDIAEVIVFQNYLPTTQRIIVENYLSAKYGLSLVSSVDLYTEDDSGYDFNVAGIGSLGGSIQNDSRGTGLVRIWNPSSLGNDEFLLWGDDNGILQATNFADIPTGVQARSNRVWRVSEVNTSGGAVDVGSVNVSFVLSNLGLIDPAHLRLLVDTDNDGVFADETPISGAASLGGNEYGFTAVSALANNLRFTIATSNALLTPLPIELRYFHAQASNESVDLEWQTMTEKDVTSFTVSSSMNGTDWTEVVTVEATGPGTYLCSDKNPSPGLSYYKLNTHGANGETKIVGITSLHRHRAAGVAAFPNPFEKTITVRIGRDETINVSVLNEFGQDCTDSVEIRVQNNNSAELNLQQLPNGPYLIKVKKDQTYHVMKKD